MSSNELSVNDFLQQLFSLFLDLNLSWNAILREQLESAQIKFDRCGSSWFFDFHYNCEPPPVPTEMRVPIAVEICTKIVVTGSRLHKLSEQKSAYWLDETSCCTTEEFVTSLSDNYRGIYLHFSEGVVFELEIVDWNARIIDDREFWQDLWEGIRIYRISDAKIVSELTTDRRGLAYD